MVSTWNSHFDHYYPSPNSVIHRPSVCLHALRVTTQAICVNLSGTVHVNNEILPGALKAIQRIQFSTRKLRLVSDTSKESKRMVMQRLNNMGIDIKLRDIYTALCAIREVIRSTGVNPFYIVSDEAMEEFAEFPTSDNPDAIVVGHAPEKFNYDYMNRAIQIISSQPFKCPIITVHKEYYHQTQDGLTLGLAPFLTALESASPLPIFSIGKPSVDFYQNLHQDLRTRPGACLMVGDDVHNDVIGAIEKGLNAVLVRTGKYTRGDENTLFIPPGETEPVPVCERALCFDSLGHFVKAFYA